MHRRFVCGQRVRWVVGAGHAEGEVLAINPFRVELLTEHGPVVRAGSEQDPAVLILSAGTKVLRLSSVVEPAP